MAVRLIFFLVKSTARGAFVGACSTELLNKKDGVPTFLIDVAFMVSRRLHAGL